jgi:cytochrome c
MKKTFIIIAALGLFAACGGGEKEAKETTSEQKTGGDLSDNPIYQKALTIITNSDCKTCHLVDEKNIGPAWRDVANKYADSANAVEYLSHKIINGGSGVWGQVPMAAHPTMPQEDAETLAKYVLLLKNK